MRETFSRLGSTCSLRYHELVRGVSGHGTGPRKRTASLRSSSIYHARVGKKHTRKPLYAEFRISRQAGPAACWELCVVSNSDPGTGSPQPGDGRVIHRTNHAALCWLAVDIKITNSSSFRSDTPLAGPAAHRENSFRINILRSRARENHRCTGESFVIRTIVSLM